MASTRPDTGPSRIPGAGTRMRGGRTTEDATTGLSGPFSHRPQAQRPRGTEEKLLPSQGPTSKTPSRIPQTLPARRQPALASTSTSISTPKSVLTKSPPGASRSAPTTSTARLGASMISTPSQIVSEARSTAAKPKPARNVLRRKQSSINQGSPSRDPSAWEPPLPEPPSPRTSSSSSDPRSGSSLDPGYVLSGDRSISASPAEIRIAHSIEVAVTTARPITILPEPSSMPEPFIIPELDRYRSLPRPSAPEPLGFELPLLTTLDLPPPPTPEWYLSELSAASASPSTRFSESPGLSAFSRETTPTSMLSQSPGLAAPFRIPPGKVRSGSPSGRRPPVTRRLGGSAPTFSEDSDELRGLPSVRESTTSSSSNSTIRAGPKDVTPPPPRRKAPPPRLDPPPRKSSNKYDKEDKETEGPQVFSKKERTAVVHSPGKPLASSTMSSRFRSPPTTPTVLATPPTPALPSRAIPVRPSRDGTVDIRSQILPIPIVHSNLSAASLNGERRGSEPTISQSIQKSATTVSLPDTYKQPSRVPAGKEVPAAKSNATTESKLTKPDPRSRHVRTPSPLIGSHSLFPFFRRNKTSTDSPVAEKKEKVARKGPAAGTGHEGYGRFGARRRSSASSTSGFRSGSTPVSSQESLASNLTTDPFLLERMNPVIIAGGEVKENRNFSIDLPRRSESSQSVSSIAVAGAGPDLSLGVGNRDTLWPGAPFNATSRDRRPSDVSDSEVLIMKPKTLARRSIQRLRSSIGPTGLGIKKHSRNPSNVSGSSTSLDSTPVSDDLHADPRPSLTRDRLLTAPAAFRPNKLLKRAKSPQRKWNLFGRSQKAQQEQLQAAQEPAANATVTASVRPIHHKAVAYYMMDSSEQSEVDKPDVKEYLRGDPPLDRSPPFESPPAFVPVPPATTHTHDFLAAPYTPLAEPVDIPHTEPIFPLRTLETPPFSARAATPDPPTPPPQTELPAPPVPKVNTFMLRSGKPSRLPQVGRIPKAIQQSVEPPPSPTKIFSRPFNRSSTHVIAHEQVYVDPESIAKGPSPAQPSTPDDNDFWTPDAEEQVHVHPNTPATRGMTPDLGRAKDMWSFSPMKHFSTDTPCTRSTIFSGITAMADATAAIPTQYERPIDDEVWDEYDDLIDDEAIDRFARVNSNAMWLLNGRNKGFIPASGGDVQPIPRALDDAVNEDEAATCSSVYTDDMTERIMAAFGGMNQQATSSPLPPVGMAPPLAAKEHISSHGQIMSVDSGTAKLLQRGSVNSYVTRRSGRSSRSSDDESPVAQVNLRVGSMSVSKWLTFGHVLFSPVRDGLVVKEGSLKRHSVLVVDGLGNDDWSFYAAETYPSATFFNLSPRPPIPSERRNSATMPLTPPNHHQIQYMSHLDKFPFAPESFKSVVYRFPVAVPESHYRNIISEARRVLQPGGYLEMSILDADLNNMGNRGRRAIRKLKERTKTSAPGTSLTPAADLVLRHLGSQGFVDIKTCRVGVPVASPIARTGSLKRERGKSDKAKEKKEKGIRTLAEMMDEEGDAADENITRMVARVGRWWYHRCYESPIGIDSTSESIWADRALLDECEGLGTSLKLTVCYAKVSDGRSRMASI